MTETRFEDKLNKFRQLLISGKLYSNISGKNEETLERRERVNKALNSLCEDLKAELKELGVEYE